MWPFTRRKNRVAIYNSDEGSIAITLREDSLQKQDRFDATCHNYAAKLQHRSDMPEPLRALLAQLFAHGAIIDCSITFGSRLRLRLTRHSVQDPSKQLLSGQRLEQFQRIVCEITGHELTATWQAGGRRSRFWRRNSADAQTFVDGFALVVRGAAQGIETATSLKIQGNNG